MIKTILAPLTGFSSDHTVLETAIAAARIGGAHIQCLHTRVDAQQMAAIYKTMVPRQSNMLQQISREINDGEQVRSSRAMAAFQDACKRHGLTVRESPAATDGGMTISWKEVETLLDETLREAMHHDLVVMAREAELPLERITGILMQSGRPLLLAPPKPAAVIGQKVAIAWKAGPEAARALTAASSILSQARQVAILCISENEISDVDDRASAALLEKQLRWHGVQVDLVMECDHPGPTSAKIREMAYTSDADLLVMGAYGHSRVREFVFGGVTRDIIADCALPVLMFH